MKLRSMLNRTLGGLLTISVLLATSLFGQGITTSAVSGVVTDKGGKPLGGASVTIVHEPSGTKATTVTRANGQYNVTGLRVGGPYTVSVSSQGMQAEPRRDVMLELGQGMEIDFVLSTEVVQMQAFTVQGTRDTTFDSNRMSAGSAFSDAVMQSIASMRADVQDIARLDSRLTLTSLDQGGQLSAQGQNFRFNSFLIDGVEANDPFGLNSNGVSSLRGPIPLEALQAVNIELNPYDVRRAGFTGALINAVTKSGSNRFEGSAQYEYTGKDWRAKNPRTGAKENFEENRYTYTFSGPILKDRLFFALSYDDFQRDSSAPVAGFVFTPASLALIDQVIARAKALGYDPGTFAGANNVSTQKTHLGKLDWNISQSHRVTLTYRKNEGVTPVFAGVTSTTGSSLSNMWYDQYRTTENYTAQAFSQWTSDFRTEVSYSITDYDGSPVNRGKPFPAVGIGGLAGTNTSTGLTSTNGFLNFGTEFSRQLNQLTTRERLYKISGEYSLGNHVFAAGFELNSTKYNNQFLQAYYGSYTFNNSGTAGTPAFRTGVENWLAGLPTAYTDAQPLAGYTIADVLARWTADNYAYFLQDTWKPTSRLTVVGGVRLDYPTADKKPPFSPTFLAAFGLRNDETNDGNYTVAPRVGFNYKLPTNRKTELRGGVGLFQGRNPAVWLANAYQNAGTAASITVNTNGLNQPVVQFQPDVTKQPIPAGTPPAPTVNITAPGFQQPSSWKGNLALDHQLPLLGLIATVEMTATKVHKGLYIDFLNYQTATTGPTTMPDGRIRYAGGITPGYQTAASPTFLTAPYDPARTTFAQTSTAGRRRVNTGGPTGGGFADVYRLNNTGKGGSSDFTLALNRPLRNQWSAGVSWTRGSAKEVSPMTSSTAGSLYTTRAVYNPNEEVAGISNTQTRDKLVARYTRVFDFFKRDNMKTTLSIVYEGRTGRTYSWVFAGDANGDGVAGSNDLFYMPSGPSDPKVRWLSATERDAFFAFAQANGLNKYAGTVVPRNSENSPWNQTVDFTITQQIPIFKRVRAEAYFQMYNLFNLLNDSWGIVEEVPFTYKRRVAGAGYDPTGNGGQGQYVYVFNGNTLDGVPVVADDTQTSRWQAKLGIRVKF
ncbi:MAG: TonB-dependent receptor [Verrucomicrobia bacterium]|nr:TonB-dependent receptor [Verrucomicrobiota bacterium]